MDLHDFYYDLPEELIAQDPLSDRSSSRLMVLDKETGEIEHKIFRDLNAGAFQMKFCNCIINFKVAEEKRNR